MPPTSDPRMIKIQLGIALHQLREDAGLTAAEAAAAIGGKGPKLSKIENGKQAATPDEVEKLGELYGVTAKRRRYLVDLAWQIPKRSPRRSSMYRDAVPDWFERFLALESDTTAMRVYELALVTGLLQTEDYIRSTILAWEPATDPRLVERQVETRLKRQLALTRPNKPMELSVVMSEATLHQAIGSPAIMRAQLDHLIVLSERPNLRLQISPFQPQNRIVAVSPFTLLHLAGQALSAVYLEDALGATYLWEPEDYTRYAVLFDRLRDSSLPPDESRTLIDSMKETYS